MGATNPIAWNRYAYVHNNPVNYTDSTGHFIDTLWDAWDLASDAGRCVFGSDALSCYMVPLDFAALIVPGVPGVADNVARHADDVPLGRVVELGSGGGENLLRIAEARPGRLIVGVEYSDEMTELAKVRAAHSSYSNIGIVQANYLEAPFYIGQFDEVIAIAPGSTKDRVVNAAEAASQMVSAQGYIYIATDLGQVPGAIRAIEQGLESRGLHGQITPGFRRVRDIARGWNPLGIPLESMFFDGYQDVWEISVRLEP